jgi:glycosyltransferase involved in cell wall biosynthesis
VNRGGGAARNTAVDRARHEWMYCLDSDNLLDPPSFRELIAMASTGAWDVVAPAETRYFRGSPSEVTHSWHWDRGYVALADPLRMYETPVASGNYLFTLDAWARAGGYPEFAGSLDAWGFGLRVLFEGARFGVCPDTFYLHRQGHDSYYMRDNDDRRAIAAAQIILPGVRLLSERDRRRLLGDGALLEFFAHIPESPLHTDEAAAGPAARVVVTQSVRHQSPATTENVHRVRAAFSRAWAQAPPRATVRRLLKTFSRRGPGGDG